jgi:hypothetical protein
MVLVGQVSLGVVDVFFFFRSIEKGNLLFVERTIDHRDVVFPFFFFFFVSRKFREMLSDVIYR